MRAGPGRGSTCSLAAPAGCRIPFSSTGHLARRRTCPVNDAVTRDREPKQSAGLAGRQVEADGQGMVARMPAPLHWPPLPGAPGLCLLPGQPLCSNCRGTAAYHLQVRRACRRPCTAARRAPLRRPTHSGRPAAWQVSHGANNGTTIPTITQQDTSQDAHAAAFAALATRWSGCPARGARSGPNHTGRSLALVPQARLSRPSHAMQQRCSSRQITRQAPCKYKSGAPPQRPAAGAARQHSSGTPPIPRAPSSPRALPPPPSPRPPACPGPDHSSMSMRAKRLWPVVTSSSTITSSAIIAIRPFQVSALLVQPHCQRMTGAGRVRRSRSYASSSVSTSPAGGVCVGCGG
jgi:hypothetical protein